MSKTVPRFIFKLFPISIGGVVLGHWFLYSWLFPDPAHRHDALTSSGHGYFPYLVAIAAVLSLLSIQYYFRLGKSQKAVKNTNLYTLIAVLFLLQSLFFVFIETVERFFHGGSEQAVSFLTSSTLVLGLLFQLLTSCIVGAFITTTVAIGKLFYEKKQTRLLLNLLQTAYIAPHVDFTWLTQKITRGPPCVCKQQNLTK